MNEMPVTYTDLFDSLKAKGLSVSFRRWAMGDTLLVTALPFESGDIKGFRRDAYIIRNSEGSWNTSVGGISLEDRYSLEEVVRFASRLMGTNDESYEAEFERRVSIIENDKNV